MVDVLGRRALNRALLARQLLLERTTTPAVEVIEKLGGMQAQAAQAPYTGLWTRVAGFRPDELSELITDRRAVRIALHRGTVHLVTAADCLAMRPLMQPIFDAVLRANPTYRKPLTGVDLTELATVGRTLVEEQPLVAKELGTLLAERWNLDAHALAYAVRCLVPLIQVPPRGLWGQSGQPATTSAEVWLGGPLKAMSLDDLALRYLAAYGPATPKDMQTWTGLTRLREVFDRLDLRTFHDESGTELYDLPDAPLPDPETPAPIRFLPEYDNLLRSHADRTRVMSEEHRARLATRNDSPKPTFLIDGFVRGTWKITRTSKTATLTIDPFTDLTPTETKALTTEATHLLTFTAENAAHDINIA